MITVHIKGGLGNQMFQYACARALALRNSDQLTIAYGQYKNDIERPFSLTSFNIAGEIISTDKVSPLSRLLERLKQKATRNFRVNFDANLVKKKGSVYLDGYFQSEKYFLDQTETIKKDLILREGLAGAAAEAAAPLQRDSHAVSLHVRRGDYVDHPDFGGIANKQYYGRAIAYLKEKIPESRFYVFSDDIDWCKNNLELGENAAFISNPEFKDYEELVLMSLCQHHIIANSSFSWWGAWLGINPQKLVIAPTRWANTHEDWYKDIIPEKWIRL